MGGKRNKIQLYNEDMTLSLNNIANAIAQEYEITKLQAIEAMQVMHDYIDKNFKE